ncbi:MAG: ABC transporter substrate-binding protein [Pseudomonadota bacterium]
MPITAAARYLALGLMVGLMGALATTEGRAEDIRIGMPAPVTGPIAYLGQHMRWAAEMATDEINAAGGVLGGKLSFLMQDTACRPADSVSAVEKLISQDQVALVLGDLCSGATLALMPIVERAQKPMIVSISTHPGVTEKAGVGGNKWVFRTVADDGMMTGVIARTMQKENPGKLAALGEDTDYGRGGITLLGQKLGDKTPFESQDFVKTSETDFLPILTRLRSAKPDAIAVFMLDQQLLNLMKQYAQFGLTAPLVGRPALVSNLVVDLLATGKFNNSWTVYPYYDAYDGAANAAFVTAYKARFKEPPHYVAFGIYESIKVAADALQRAGTADGAKLRDALAATDYKGILGPIKFDDHNQAHTNLMLMRVRDGKLSVQELIQG